MNLKRLLVGSAAVFTVASAAQAADAIVAAQPEPVEYVRICDGYGAGYFFIPGTETCLKLGGQVRTEGKWNDAYNPDSKNGTLWHTRAELSIATATDTEYGPLKTNVLLRWDWQEGRPTTTNMKAANISLGGFLVGKADSQFNSFMGYAGDVINDDVVYNGPYELNQLTYNYDAGNGFTAVASVEDSNSSGSGASYGASWWRDDKRNHYAPDAVAGVGFRSGAWGFKVVGGYDSIAEAGAVKARFDADFGVFTAFLMGGWNTDGSKLNKYAGTNVARSACPTGRPDLCGWGDWAVWGGVGVPINEKLKWNVQLAYTDSKIFAATTNIRWSPVKNLQVTPELSYTNFDSVNRDQWSGILRFQRSF